MTKRILCIAGTRPEIIKMAPVIKALRREPWADVVVANSGQHREMSSSAFAGFGLTPDHDLAVMTEGQTLSTLTARLFQSLEPALTRIGPDLVIAQGDTTTVMATAATCFYLGIPFAHVEAGLRTGHLQDPFPEEFNRILCGRISALHFAPTATARGDLINEGVASESIVLSGNTVIDSLLATKGNLPRNIERSRKTILLTAHRRENFGAPLENVFRAIRDVICERDDLQLVYPVHPNPNVARVAQSFFRNMPDVHLCEPMSYEDFIGAMRQCYLVISDSGGVQEEAPALGKPVLVIRNKTERPEAVRAGVARLIGTDYEAVRGSLKLLLDDRRTYSSMARGVSPYGDGRASERIADAIEVFFRLSPRRRIADFDASASLQHQETAK